MLQFQETVKASRETEKILNTDLIAEIEYMWNIKSKVISVIIGTTQTISESFRKYLSNIPGKHNIKELQKTSHQALHTYFGKYRCKSTEHSTWE